MPFFFTVFQLYHDGQCTYACFPGVLLIRIPYNILSKPLTAFPHNHCQNNRQQWEKNESCCYDYHQSSVGWLYWYLMPLSQLRSYHGRWWHTWVSWLSPQLGIKLTITRSWVWYACNWATQVRPSILRKNIGRAWNRTIDILFSSPQHYQLSYGAQPNPKQTNVQKSATR